MNKEISNAIILLKLAEKKGDTNKAAQYREQLTDLYFKTGDKISALKSCAELLDMLHDTDDKNKLGVVFLKLGQILDKSYYGANSYLKKAATIFKETKDSTNLAVTEYCLGEVYRSKGFDDQRYEKALSHYQQATELFHSQNNPKGLTITLIAQGKCFIQIEEYNQAEKFLEIATDCARDLDNPTYLSDALYYLAQTYHFEEKSFKAQKQIEEAIEISRAIEDKDNLSKQLQLYGEILLSLEKYQDAAAALRECEDIQRKAGKLDNLTNIIHLLALIHFNSQEYDKAAMYFQEELLLCNGTAFQYSQIFCNLGLSYSHLGYNKEAITFFEKQVDALSGDENFLEEYTNALGMLANAYFKIGDNNLEAEKKAKAAIKLYEQIKKQETDSHERKEIEKAIKQLQQIISEINILKSKDIQPLSDTFSKTIFTPEYIRKAVIELISEILQVKGVVLKHTLQGDLGADNIQILKIIIAIETEFDISIDLNALDEQISVGDIIKIVKNSLKHSQF